MKCVNQAKSGFSLSTLRHVPGWLWREFERDPGHLVPCHARSRMVLWESGPDPGELGGGISFEWSFPSGGVPDPCMWDSGI